MNQIKVFIADDHPLVRKGMVRLLRTFPRIGVIKDVSNGRELIDLLLSEPTDIALMDIEMPVLGGYETAKIITKKFPLTKILILSMHTEEVFVSRMLEVGVNGFIAKSSEPDELEKAIYSVVDNDFYRNTIVQNSLKKMGIGFKEKPYGKLSTREIEILLLICEELSPGEISERLQISEKTFFNHRSNILEKTGAISNVGLFKYAVAKGLVNVS